MTARRPRRRHTGTRALAAALLVAAAPVVLGACADDGRELRPPRPDQTTTTAPATTVPGTGTVAASGSATGGPTTALVVSSPLIAEAGPIPEQYTCRGADISPPLVWGPVPQGTAELAVVAREVDTGVIHWVVAALPPDTGGLAEDTLPVGAVVATNDFAAAQWDGPCPEDGIHYYDIRVYALADTTGIQAGEPGSEAVAQITSGRALANGALSITATAPTD